MNDVLCDIKNGVFDCSALKECNFCERSFYYRYVCGYDVERFSIGAEFGKWVHAGLHGLLTGGLDAALQAVHDTSKEAPRIEDPNEFRTPEFAEEVVRQYLIEYQDDEYKPVEGSLE